MQCCRDLESRKEYIRQHRFYIGKEAPVEWQQRRAYPQPDSVRRRSSFAQEMLRRYPDLGKHKLDRETDEAIIRILAEIVEGTIRWQNDRREIDELQWSIDSKLEPLWIDSE